MPILPYSIHYLHCIHEHEHANSMSMYFSEYTLYMQWPIVKVHQNTWTKNLIEHGCLVGCYCTYCTHVYTCTYVLVGEHEPPPQRAEVGEVFLSHRQEEGPAVGVGNQGVVEEDSLAVGEEGSPVAGVVDSLEEVPSFLD